MDELEVEAIAQELVGELAVFVVPDGVQLTLDFTNDGLPLAWEAG